MLFWCTNHNFLFFNPFSMKKLFSILVASAIFFPSLSFALDYDLYRLPMRESGESLREYFQAKLNDRNLKQRYREARRAEIQAQFSQTKLPSVAEISPEEKNPISTKFEVERDAWKNTQPGVRKIRVPRRILRDKNPNEETCGVSNVSSFCQNSFQPKQGAKIPNNVQKPLVDSLSTGIQKVKARQSEAQKRALKLRKFNPFLREN